MYIAEETAIKHKGKDVSLGTFDTIDRHFDGLDIGITTCESWSEDQEQVKEASHQMFNNEL